MRYQIFFYLLAFSIHLPAQVQIYLEDLRGEGFRVVVNQYYQNQAPYRKLVLDKLPLGSHQLHFLLGEKHFSRPLPPLEKGLYHYVITENFVGETQLRFRGKLKSLPAEVTVLNYRQDSLWRAPQPMTLLATDESEPEKAKGIADKAAPLPEKVLPPTPVRSTDKQPAQKVESLAADTPNAKLAEVQSKVPLESAEQDSPGELESPGTAVSKAESSIDPGTQQATTALVEKLKQLDYEYEKMQLAQDFLNRYALDQQTALQILGAFKYDQTRLMFLRSALDKNPALYAATEKLKAAFEYEMSRRQLEEMQP